MTRYLLDTGTAADFIYDRRGVYGHAKVESRRGNKIGICPPVLGELWYGVEYSASRDRSAVQLRRVLPELMIWPFDVAAAQEYGRLYAELRRRGRLMQQIDVQIAAIALTLGCVVVSMDGDLLAVPGLTVENWAAPPTP